MSAFRRTAAAAAALREMLTGATIRAIAGIRDMGEIILAKAHNADGGDLVDRQDTKDAWVSFTDAMNDMPGQAKLHFPGGILFAIPKDGDNVVILRGCGLDGPGVTVMLHGHGGDADRVPAWAFGDSAKDGLYTQRVLRLESSKDNLEIATTADDKDILVTTSKGNVSITVAGDGKKVTITAGGSVVTVNLDGDITLVPKSGQVVSAGDVASNTKFAPQDWDLVRTYMDKNTTLTNDLKTQVNNLVTDVGNIYSWAGGLSVSGEAVLTPGPLGGSESASSVSDDDVPATPGASTIFKSG
jgi:hypothetical protein